jgi:hypothetical protein
MNTIAKKYQKLLDDFPFLTLVSYGGNEYVGIVQNVDNNLASMYNFDSIKTIEQKQKFLDLGEEWWWGTNRMIPINIIFRTAFDEFKPCLITMSVKDFTVVHGPVISLNNLNQKRIKRRNIQLVRKV